MCSSRYHSPDVAGVLLLSRFVLARVKQSGSRDGLAVGTSKDKDVAKAMTAGDVENVSTL